MRHPFAWILVSLVAFAGCGTDPAVTVDVEETAQQVGDVMASIDESGGNANGSTSLTRAGSCASASTYGACAGSTIVRTFNGCTIGGATLTGTVTLTWSGGTCALGAANDTITRDPSFTLTGRRGATMTVSKTGAFGQRLTWQSGSGVNKVFAFDNDGIRRVIASGSSTLFDFTTTTTSPLIIQGTQRTNRLINAGTLRVANNLTSVTCDFTPVNVTWSATCNCADSGSWDATCSDGTSASVFITGCGTAIFTLGEARQAMNFDRCYGI